MRYIKKFESLDVDIEQNIIDICQELKDDFSIRITISGLGASSTKKCVVIRTTIWESPLEWHYIKDTCLRIKDYLGDKFIEFKYRVSWTFGQGEQAYQVINLDDDTSINSKMLSVAISYHL